MREICVPNAIGSARVSRSRAPMPLAAAAGPLELEAAISAIPPLRRESRLPTIADRCTGLTRRPGAARICP
jgi:hypothetical protein